MYNKTKITMQTIADDLGLSRYTVSAVLNDRTDHYSVKEETIKRVRDYVAKIGYHQNIGALSMRGKYSKDLGIVAANSHAYPAHDQIIKAMESYTARQKLSLVMFSVHNSNLEKLSEVAQQIKIYNTRKVIVLASNFQSQAALASFLKNLRRVSPETLIYVYGYCDISDLLAGDKHIFSAFSNAVDQYKFIYDIATSHGYERIMLRDRPERMPDFFSTMEIFDLTTLPIEYPSTAEFVMVEKVKLDQGAATAEQLKNYDFRKKKTLIFINDDFISTGFACRMQELGYRMPQDFGLISLDNLPTTERLNISSIGYDHEKVVNEMIQWINTGKAKIQHKKFPVVMNNARSF